MNRPNVNIISENSFTLNCMRLKENFTSSYSVNNVCWKTCASLSNTTVLKNASYLYSTHIGCTFDHVLTPWYCVTYLICSVFCGGRVAPCPMFGGTSVFDCGLRLSSWPLYMRWREHGTKRNLRYGLKPLDGTTVSVYIAGAIFIIESFPGMLHLVMIPALQIHQSCYKFQIAYCHQHICTTEHLTLDH